MYVLRKLLELDENDEAKCRGTMEGKRRLGRDITESLTL